MESFGFTGTLRAATAGQAFPQWCAPLLGRNCPNTSACHVPGWILREHGMLLSCPKHLLQSVHGLGADSNPILRAACLITGSR